MYAEVAWLLVSLGTQVQSQIILNPDYFPNYLSVFYDYDEQTGVRHRKQNNINICYSKH